MPSSFRVLSGFESEIAEHSLEQTWETTELALALLKSGYPQRCKNTIQIYTWTSAQHTNTWTWVHVAHTAVTGEQSHAKLTGRNPWQEGLCSGLGSREATNAQIQGWDQRQHCAISHHDSPLTTRHAAANVRTGVHEEVFLDNAIPKGSSLLLGKQQPAHIPGFWSLLSCPTKAPGHRGMRTRCALRLIESKKVVQRISCFLPSFKI